jgi:hypothetical protein
MTQPETDQELIYVIKYVDPHQYEEIRAVTKELTLARDIQKALAHKTFKNPVWDEKEEAWMDGPPVKLWSRADLRSYYVVEVYPVQENLINYI